MRLRVVAVVLAGQLVGLAGAVLIASLVGLGALVFPALDSPSTASVLLPLLFIGCPLFFSWALSRNFAASIRPFVVSMCSYALSALLFLWLIYSTGSERQAVGAILLPGLWLLPFTSSLGAFLATYIPPASPSESAG